MSAQSIEFTPHKRWIANKDGLAARIAEILPVTAPTPQQMIYKLETDRWILGSSNDWRLTIRENGVCELSYRYGTAAREERMQALKMVLEWFLE